MQTVVSVKNPVAIPSLPFHRLAPDLLRRRRRVAGYAEQLVPEGHMLGGEDPVHHPRAPVVVDPGIQNHPVANGFQVLRSGLGMTYEPNPEVHELLLHRLAVLVAHRRPFSRLAVKALASWMATLGSSETGQRSLTTSPLTNPFGPKCQGSPMV